MCKCMCLQNTLVCGKWQGQPKHACLATGSECLLHMPRMGFQPVGVRAAVSRWLICFALGGCAGSRDRPSARHAQPAARRRRRWNDSADFWSALKTRIHFYIVSPQHKRQATASNLRFCLMQATGDSQPRQRLDPAGPSRQSGGFDTAPNLSFQAVTTIMCFNYLKQPNYYSRWDYSPPS